jgi:hypothetical protein
MHDGLARTEAIADHRRPTLADALPHLPGFPKAPYAVILARRSSRSPVRLHGVAWPAEQADIRRINRCVAVFQLDDLVGFEVGPIPAVGLTILAPRGVEAALLLRLDARGIAPVRSPGPEGSLWRALNRHRAEPKER